jgi:hypothetical protein
VPTGGTILDFDLGSFQIATAGCPSASTTVGQLWVSYDIVFYKKNMALGSHLLSSGIAATTLTAVSATNLLGTGTQKRTGNLQCTFSGTTLSFPPLLGSGSYMITYFVVGTAAAVGTAAYTLTNCVFITAGPTSLAGTF